MATGWFGGWSADSTWLGWAGSRVISIGQMRPGFTTLVWGLALLAFAQAAYIYYLRRKTGAAGHGQVTERLDKLAAAMTLLTDTTEAGLSALAVEVQRVQQRPPSPRASTKRAVSKRVSAAAAQGKSLTDIAAAEAVSEDEVQLHAALAAVAAAAKGQDPCLEASTSL